MGITIAITFGNERFVNSLKRIKKEFINTNLFRDVFAYTPEDFGIDFKEKHTDFLTTNPRGYGYWLWKPYFVKKTLDSMNDGDILVYADAGCKITGNLKPLLDFCYHSEHKFIVAPNCPVTEFTKMDLYEECGTTYKDWIGKPSIEANRLIICKTKHTMNIIDEWWRLSQIYHNIDDSPSIKPNSIDFKEHRHDQAILTLLLLVRGCHVIHLDSMIRADRIRE